MRKHITNTQILTVEMGHNGDFERRLAERDSPSISRRKLLQSVAGTGIGLATLANSSTVSAASGTAHVNGWDGWINDSWSHQSLSDQPAQDPPIVVAGPPSYEGNQPCHVRLKNVSTESFDLAIEEWDDLDGGHVAEKVHAFHFTEGTATTGEFGESFEGISTTCSDYDFTFVDFTDGHFPIPPIVLATVQSNNGGEAVVPRLSDITAEDCLVKMQEQEDRTTNDGDPGVAPGHVQEDVGLLAIQPGSGTIGSRTFEARTFGEIDTNGWYYISFEESYTDPIFVAQLQTYNGADPCSLRYRNLTADGVEVMIEEETSKDEETDHVGEMVGYMVVEDRRLRVGEMNVRRSSDTQYHDDSSQKLFTDFNWNVGLFDKDLTNGNDDYYLGISSLNHLYKRDDAISYSGDEVGFEGWERIDDARINTKLEGTNGESLKSGTTANFYTDLTAVSTWTRSEWNDWYSQEKGQDYTQQRIWEELKNENYYEKDKNEALWLDVMLTLGGVAASGVGLGAVAVGSGIAGGLLLAREVAGTLSDTDCDVDHLSCSKGPLVDFCFCSAVPLAIYGARLDVSIDANQTEPVRLNIWQSVGTANTDVVDLDSYNAIHWKIKFPAGTSESGTPWIEDVTLWNQPGINCGSKTRDDCP